MTLPATPTLIRPTDEQQQALDLYATGQSLVIEAGAGTGKTSTLRLLAAATAPGRRIQYVAFNKALVMDARASMPDDVKCNTAHSLAFAAVGKNYAERLNGRRMKTGEIARLLRLDGMWVEVAGERKFLGPPRLAGIVLSAVRQFCQTADAAPGVQHFPYVQGIDMPDGAGKRTYANNRKVSAALLPALLRAWADIQRPDAVSWKRQYDQAAGRWATVKVAVPPEGALPFEHDNYLKIWQLSDPVIRHPVIMFDEAQDANPVIADIIARQTSAQLVYVGDTNQSIMSFTGAVNALAQVETDARSFLTQSFRFGPAVADLANRVLTWLESPMMLRGLPSIPSTVGPIDSPDAVLCRTNAVAVGEVLRLQAAGVAVHLVGGSAEVVEFAEAARDLQEGRRTEHRDLWIFSTWSQVKAYVDQDEQGGDLRRLVRLVDDFGVDVILAALGDMVPEARADVVVSTAHKSKGREWDHVVLAGDFPEVADMGPDEMRLLYVAITRAKLRVDVDAVAGLLDEPEPEPPASAPVPTEPAEEEPTAPVPARTTFICQRPECGRSYHLGTRTSGLADEQFCGGLCRMKAARTTSA